MNLLLDRDGAPTDPESGTTRSLAYVLARLGYAAPQRASLRRHIGRRCAPVAESFLGTSEASGRAAHGERRREARFNAARMPVEEIAMSPASRAASSAAGCGGQQ
jgi:phosphoglycolate phosphatase-like HAD superfamily hydrolase